MQVARGERDRFAGADQQRRVAARSSRTRVRASATAADATDTAFAPICVSVRTRFATEKLSASAGSGRAGCPLLLRRAIGSLELAEDLRLAEHHRVQAACDAEDVLDCRRAADPRPAQDCLSRGAGAANRLVDSVLATRVGVGAMVCASAAFAGARDCFKESRTACSSARVT